MQLFVAELAHVDFVLLKHRCNALPHTLRQAERPAAIGMKIAVVVVVVVVVVKQTTQQFSSTVCVATL